MNFDQAFALLTSPQVEGGYSDHKSDPGGKTRYGVTEDQARRIGYTGDMREFPLDLAQKLYRREYWDQINADSLPDLIRYPVFDAAVNSGPAQATKWLQRVVGVNDDGVIGPQTLQAVNNMGQEQILRRMVAQRLRFMAGLSNWPAFGRGWANRIALLLEM